MSRQTLGLSEELAAYVSAQVSPVDPVLQELAAETAALLPDSAQLQIAPEEGALLTTLVWLAQPHLAVEVGTFTGYSSIAIARGLPRDGRLLCFDASAEWTAIAQRWWAAAGLDDRTELRLGDARERLRELEAEPLVDFAFIDADKPSYPQYYETILGRLAPDGVIAVDNTLARGRVLAPDDEHARAIAAFNDLVRTDQRVTSVLVPIADGLTLIRRR